MSSKENPISAWPVLAWWIFASLVGWAAGLAIGMGFTRVAGELPGINEDRVGVYAILLSVGAATVDNKWRVLTGYLPRPMRWVPATVAGYLLAFIPFAIPRFPNLPGPELLDDALLFVLIGGAVGIAQWWVLRQHYYSAAVWVPATAAGFLSFLWLVANPTHSQSEFVTVGTIFGTLAATVPGAVLTWMVRQPLAAAL